MQHVALLTKDIVRCVSNLRDRGFEFIRVPDTYYEIMRKHLKISNVELEEGFEAIRRLNIRIDFGQSGYLLKIFTKPVLNRLTVFLEKYL